MTTASDIAKGIPLTKLYLRYLTIEKGLSQNTIYNYGKDLRRLTHFAYQSARPIHQLCPTDIRKFIFQLTLNGLSASTIRRIASTIRSFYAFLVLDDYIDSSPTDLLETPPPSTHLPTVLSETQVQRLLNTPDITTNIGCRDRAILELMYATGLRASELVSLRNNDIDLISGLVTCHGKGSRQRIIPFGKSAAHSIRTFRDTTPSYALLNSHLFTNRGKPLTRQLLWTLLNQYGDAAGIPSISPHTLRHSFATHLLNHGAELKHVQALLGHSDISTTCIYTHVTATHLVNSYRLHHPRGSTITRLESTQIQRLPKS